MSKLRVGVVGAGRLGGFHAQKLVASEKADLVAVVDPLPKARNRLASQCGSRALAHPDHLLGQIDAAVIAAPTRFHHELGMTLLRSGVHVLMEKPLAPSRAEAEDLVDAARRMNVVLQVGHVERFNPAVAAAAPHVRDPKYIEAVRASGFTFRSTDIGVVLDLMIHDLDLVLDMVGSPVCRVDALGLSVLGGHEDVANARLCFESGCVATFSASRVSHEAVRRMQVWSADAMADIDFATRTTKVVCPSETLLARRFDVDALAPNEVEHLQEHLLDEHLPREVFQAGAVDALALEIDDFLQSIRGSREPRVTGRQGLEAVSVAERILEAIGSHAWGQVGGPVGPLATPPPSVIPSPHWEMPASKTGKSRKEAG